MDDITILTVITEDDFAEHLRRGTLDTVPEPYIVLEDWLCPRGQANCVDPQCCAARAPLASRTSDLTAESIKGR